MRNLLTLLAIFLSLVAHAVTFDIDGIRYNILSMDEKTVEVSIISKSISYPTYSTYKEEI